MTRECHVRICGGGRVRFPPATRQRCGKRRRERRQVGVRKAIAVDVSKEPRLTPKLGRGISPGMSLAGAR